MNAIFGVGEMLMLLLWVGLLTVYGRGWWRLHQARPEIATRARLLSIGVASVALGFALVWPLPDWSNYLLTMRSLQKVLICMVAAPLLWLAVPVHMLLWGLGRWARQGYVRARRQRWVQATLRAVTQPLVAWFLFVATFLVWHDPSLAKFMLGEAGAQLTWHYAAPWLLLVASLLFWWPVIDSGPRFQRAFPAWLLIAYLVSVEVFNMVAGISIAFSMEPLYAHYVAVRAQLPADALPWGPVTDQIAGGAIVWVFGSMVYISSIVFVLFGLFRKEADSTTPLRLPDWDANAKFIAPGLEHRVAQNELRKADLSHH